VTQKELITLLIKIILFRIFFFFFLKKRDIIQLIWKITKSPKLYNKKSRKLYNKRAESSKLTM
jgi:hypothetical protein